MAIEQFTENLVLKEMKSDIGKTSFGYISSRGCRAN